MQPSASTAKTRRLGPRRRQRRCETLASTQWGLVSDRGTTSRGIDVAQPRGAEHDDGFAEQVDSAARAMCAPRINDTNLLGGYLVLPQGSPGSEKAQFFVEAKGTNDGELLALVAEQYFSVTTDAIRRHDPNHLNLGLRGANLAAAEAVGLQPLSFKAFRKVMAADRHVDVIDWHGYLDPPDGKYAD
eukprot:m.320180 g.320180  ORF g.320180 m.320180 type:complete len:187 (+) comp16449_c0_seq4:8450-9010(+)